MGVTGQKKFEEYAYVLHYRLRSSSKTVKGRSGNIVEAIGESYFTLLELLAFPQMTFEVGERVYIGKDKRDKIVSVLGKLKYEDLSPAAKSELPNVIEMIVKRNEKHFVNYFNTLQPVTPRLHALELIPGIGKTLTRVILEERERKPFESFKDIEERIGFREPEKQIAKRIIEELEGARIMIFVRR